MSNQFNYDMTGLYLLDSAAANVIASEAAMIHPAEMRARRERAAAIQTHRRDRDGIATIELQGLLTKHANSFSPYGSTVLFRRDVRNASLDPDIRAIMIRIESGGGHSSGIYEAADEVRKARGRKPVHVFAEDLVASGAYWIASQATIISTNVPGKVGSIGTYSVLTDSSKGALARGVTTHVIRAGAYKGLATPGTEITKEQQAEVQRLVDSTNELFLEGVKVGRNMPMQQVRALADGRLHPSDRAKGYGLVDHIETYGDAFARLEQATASRGGASNSQTDPVVQFRARVATLETSGMTRRAATRQVSIDDPDLHHAYVEAVNGR